jgi:anti-sigma factor RsiW
MDIQTIEPVLIDYVLGGATPEVAALVEAFQEKDAEAQACVKRWRTVAGLARQAMGSDQSTSLPTFPERKLQVARQMAQRRQAIVWAAALAASVLIGYLIGMNGRDRKMASEIATAGSRPAHVETTSNPESSDADFWSMARIREVAERNAARPPRAPAASLENRWDGFPHYGG